jgi:RNA polymerase sigma factor (sigma-70 family)
MTAQIRLVTSAGSTRLSLLEGMKKLSSPGATHAGEFPATPAGWTERAFEQFSAGLYRFLLRRLRSAENAEDLSQEVYLRLLRAVQPAQIRFPQAYVYRIALNVLCEFRVRERGGDVTFDSEAAEQATTHLADEAALPEQAYEERAREARLQGVIGELPPMQRAVLRLATQHPLSHAQIAEQLGISVSTMRNHLYKAMDYCRHRFADEDGRKREPETS